MDLEDKRMGKDDLKSESDRLTRRSFIKKSGATLAAFSIVPRQVLGGKDFIPPSDKIQAACIGVGSLRDIN